MTTWRRFSIPAVMLSTDWARKRVDVSCCCIMILIWSEIAVLWSCCDCASVRMAFSREREPLPLGLPRRACRWLSCSGLEVRWWWPSVQ